MSAPAEGTQGRPRSIREDRAGVRVYARITDHGEAVTGYPAGTVLPWVIARSLPPGPVDGPRVATWEAIRGGRDTVAGQ